MASDLRGLAQFGPFFAVGRLDSSDGWRRLGTLLDGDVLDERVARVRAALSASARGEVELRVAASTMSLSLFARLVSPVLAAASLGLRLPRPRLESSWWQPADRGPWPLALSGPDADAAPAEAVREVLTPIADCVSARYGLSMRILRGNAASAVYGAVAVIRSVRVDLFPVAWGIADALLSGPLAGTGELCPQPGNGSAQRFVRSSCCLYYRVPGGGYCADCVLTRRMGRAPERFDARKRAPQPRDDGTGTAPAAS